jgi:hypothetical protein
VTQQQLNDALFGNAGGLIIGQATVLCDATDLVCRGPQRK